jgi:predicted dehydrogenase
VTHAERPLVVPRAADGSGRYGPAPVRFGVLGATSEVAREAVVPALEASPKCEVVAAASLSRDGPGAYDRLLDDEAVEAVYVPLPNGLHRLWVERAAAAGKHVLCEKPLAVTVADARAMAEACRAADVCLAEAYMTPFHPRSAVIEEVLHSGTLGRLHTGFAAFTFPHGDPTDHRWDPDLGGGALLDVGIYCVAPLLAAAGQSPLGVAAVASVTERGVDGSLTGLLDLGDGFAATVQVSFCAPERQELEVIGTEGALVVDRAFTPGPADDTFAIVRPNGTLEERRTGGGDPYRGMVDHVATVLRGGADLRRPPAASIALLEVLERLRAAAGLTPAVP